MKNCDEFRELISTYIDGELSAEAEAPLREHLASCPECARFLELLESVSGGLETVSAPPELRARVMDAVAPKPKRGGHYILRFGAMAAVFALVIFAGSRMLPSMKSGSSGALDSAMSAPESANGAGDDFVFGFSVEEQAPEAGGVDGDHEESRDSADYTVMEPTLALPAPGEAPLPSQEPGRNAMYNWNMDEYTAQALTGVESAAFYSSYNINEEPFVTITDRAELDRLAGLLGYKSSIDEGAWSGNLLYMIYLTYAGTDDAQIVYVWDSGGIAACIPDRAEVYRAAGTIEELLYLIGANYAKYPRNPVIATP